jgi:hypothetical protein
MSVLKLLTFFRFVLRDGNEMYEGSGYNRDPFFMFETLPAVKP